MTDRPELMPLTLWLGRLHASGLDVAGVVGDVCVALPEALGVAGVAALAVDAQDPLGVLVASDGRARRLGETQRRAGRGPLLEALCAGRSPVTPDMTRVGPPPLAAAAAETGLVSSVALPVGIGGERTAAVQLLGHADRPVTPDQVEAVRPVLQVLAARLADVLALRLARAAVADPVAPTPRPRPTPRHAPEPPAPRRAPDDVPTEALRAVPSPRPR